LRNYNEEFRITHINHKCFVCNLF